MTGPWVKVSGHQAQERASGKLQMCILNLVGNSDWWHRWCPWAGDRPLQDFRICEVPQFLQVQWIYQHGMGLHLRHLNGRHKYSGLTLPGPLEQLPWWHPVKYMWIYVQVHSSLPIHFNTHLLKPYKYQPIHWLHELVKNKVLWIRESQWYEKHGIYMVIFDEIPRRLPQELH